MTEGISHLDSRLRGNDGHDATGGDRDAWVLRDVEFAHAAGFALRIPSLSLAAGKIHAIVGQNGAGKTTLLELLAFLAFPARGNITFFGQAARDERAALALRRRLGVVFQEPHLFRRDLLRNAAFGPRMRGLPRAAADQRAREALAFVGLAGLAGRNGRELSGGEKKRAALAMALAAQPEALLLDELTSHVDNAYRRELEALVLKANVERGCTVAFTTHDLDQAQRLAHHVIALHDGAVGDFVPENVFAVQIVVSGGRKIARLPGGVELEIAAGDPGPAKIVLPPESIVVSREAFDSSARNRLRGMIVRAELRGEAATLTVDVGALLLARLSLASYRELRLDLGQTVTLTCKIHSVRVI